MPVPFPACAGTGFGDRLVAPRTRRALQPVRLVVAERERVGRRHVVGDRRYVQLVGAGVALVDQSECTVRHLAARQLVVERVGVGGREPVAVGERFHVERQRLVDDAARDGRPRSRGGLARAHGGDAAHGVAQILDLPAGGIGDDAQRQIANYNPSGKTSMPSAKPRSLIFVITSLQISPP